VIELWPGFYRNFLVATAQPVDVRGYGGDQALEKLKANRLEDMNYFMELENMQTVILPMRVPEA